MRGLYSRYKVLILLLFVGIELNQNPKSLSQLVAVTSAVSYLSLYKLLKIQNVKSSVSLIALLFALYFSFLFPISNNSRWMVLLISTMLYLLYSFIRKRTAVQTFGPIFLDMAVMVFGVNSLFAIFRTFTIHTLQFLTFGYDNAFHFTQYRAFRESSWFPYASNNLWSSDFSLFKTSPQGLHALFSFLTSVLIGDNHNALLELNSYGFLSLGFLVTATICSINLIKKQIRPQFNKNINIIVFWLIAIIAFATLGTLFTNGFPPYILSSCVILLWLIESNRQNGLISFTLNLCMAIFCVFVIHPGPMNLLVLPALIVFVRIIKKTREGNWRTGAVAAGLSISVLMYLIWTMGQTSGKFGWHQILQPGGCKAPGLFSAMTALICFIYVIYRSRTLIASDPLIQVGISGMISVALFSALTIWFTGSIQYYAIKQFYIWEFFAGIIIIRYCLLSLKEKQTTILLYLLLISSILSAPMIFPGNHSGPWMGVFPEGLKASIQSSVWENQIVNAQLLLKQGKIAMKLSDKCFITKIGSHPSDLNSRWLNSFSTPVHMSDPCFGGFWNSDQTNLNLLASKLHKVDLKFVIFSDLSHIKDFKEPSSSNLQVFLFSETVS